VNRNKVNAASERSKVNRRAGDKEVSMKRQLVTSMGALSVVIAAALAAPAAEPGPASRLADGRPDLQGVWDYGTITPLERPAALGTKAFFTAEEAAAWERGENLRQDRDTVDPETGNGIYGKGGVIPHNEFWYDRGNRVVGTRRTSLIVDPPDGRLPVMTPEGKKRADLAAFEQTETLAGRPHADSYEDRPLGERCLAGVNSGPPMTPGQYNNNFQLFQTGETVVILNEMIHDARIIPLDGRPHGGVPQWKGDSRGHWEGDTLVIDTVNFKRETSLRNSSASTRLVERFTRTDADTLVYEFTVEDPSVWTRPWTAVIPMRRSDQPIYEFACHEGNYTIANVLAGARATEKAAGEAAATPQSR
jgi:hypothetical protein